MPSYGKIIVIKREISDLMTLSTKILLFSGSEAIHDHCSEPLFQPPMLSMVTRLGFFCFRATNLLQPQQM